MANSNRTKWFDDLNQFYNMLRVQESRLTAFTEIIQTENKIIRKINYEKVTQLAAKYLEVGNVYIEERKYKLGIACYEEAVLLNYTNNDMLFDLLNRLSATYFVLHDYNLSLSFAEKSFKIDPDYNIGISRAIQCCIELNQINKSMIYLNKYLVKNKGSPEEELEKKELKKKIEHKRLAIELNNRKLNFSKQKIEKFVDEVKTFNTKYSKYLNRVHMNKSRLVWPLIFTCPEQEIIVFIKKCHEDNSLYSQLETIFSQKSTWGTIPQYTADTVNIYYDCVDGSSLKIMKIDSKKTTIGNVLAIHRCPIEFGVPTFIFFFAGGEQEKEALADYPKYIAKFIKSEIPKQEITE